jgi:hypothetical protein
MAERATARSCLLLPAPACSCLLLPATARLLLLQHVVQTRSFLLQAIHSSPVVYLFVPSPLGLSGAEHAHTHGQLARGITVATLVEMST